jgi:rRNA maturation RNase YbeY
MKINTNEKIKNIKAYIQKIVLTKRYTELNINIVNPYQIKILNKKYRNKKSYTDMLTFKNEYDYKNNMTIGDIILCPEIIKKKQKSITWNKNINHCLLHLLKYDHIESKDFKIMLNIEKLLIK